jgi:hypothetical protein
MENILENNMTSSETQAANELHLDDLDEISGGGLFGACIGFLVGGVSAAVEGKSVSETLQSAATLGAFGAVLPEP